MRVPILFLVVASVFVSAQLCAFAAIGGDERDDGPPAWEAPEAASQTWIDDCQKRIDKAWTKNKKGGQISENARCVFFIKPNGRLDDYFVYSVSAPKAGDDIALKVVRKASPFKNSPTYLLKERRMLVTFSRVEGLPKSKISWDSFDYTFVKPEDRLTNFPEKKSKKRAKSESSIHEPGV